MSVCRLLFFLFKQKTAYEMRISDWSSDVCSSDLAGNLGPLCTKSLVICGEAGFYTNEYGIRGAMLRAYDKATGEEKGEVYMHAPQSGSPMPYMLNNRHYIVVAIGGGTYQAELVAIRVRKSVV